MPRRRSPPNCAARLLSNSMTVRNSAFGDLQKAPLMNEFLIFKPGVNKTLKGDFLFDSIAAASVMAAFETHGADVMIDLEHLSLDTESPAFDPDARGWCKLAVKPDGSL